MLSARATSILKTIPRNYTNNLVFANSRPASTIHKPEDFVNTAGPFDKITHEPRYPPKKNVILNNVLEAVGNTPLIRLNKVPQAFGVKCEILAKCEYFNPGGSIKDRIAMRMLNDAEKHGRVNKDSTIIEPSSGNTAISLGLVSVVKGYKTIITLADKNAGEKVTTMKALGLDVVKTSSACKYDDPESYFEVAKRMSKEIPGGITLDQYSNISNALANYDQTAEEILEACDNKLDAVVVGAGTGGTITGIAVKVKERLSNCKVVGVDPMGSIMAEPESLNTKSGPYKVEGMGHDFIPNTLVRRHIDHWVKTEDPESLDVARRLIKDEGLLIGASSGAIVYAAIRYALEKNLDENHRIVAVLPDSIRNYMTKFALDEYMVDYGFLPLDHFKNSKNKLHGRTVKELELESVRSYDNQSTTIKEALDLFNKGETEIVVEKEGKIAGVITAANFTTTYYEKGLKPTDTIKEINPQTVPIVTLDTDLSVVSKFFERHSVVLVREGDSKLKRIRINDLLKVNA